jgi:Tfp pilus assembly protein FimV
MALRSPELLTAPPRRHLTAVPRPGGRERFGRVPREATIHVLHPPTDPGPAAPLRLTRRGVMVVSVAVALFGAALVWLAALSAPRPSAGGAAAHPQVVTVRPGDTLWGIAARLTPDADPSLEVAVLQRANHLRGVMVQPGQRLRTG